MTVNGELSGSIPVKRGLRQGCSLSPLLYVLVIDSLLRETMRVVYVEQVQWDRRWKTISDQEWE